MSRKTKLLICFGITVILPLCISTITAEKLLQPAPKTILHSSEVTTEPLIIKNRIHGWYVPHTAPRGVVLLCHGIRASRLAMVERAKILNRAGYAALLIDLQAHGETPGKQITVGYLEKEDVKESLLYIKERHPDLPVGVIGVSLGGASTILASPLPIDALVIESVYSTLDLAVTNRVTKRLGPLGIIPGKILLAQVALKLKISPNELRPIDHIDKITCPVFVISGTDDKHTTKEETEALYKRANSPKELWIVSGAEHEDIMQFTPVEYENRVLRFLNSAMIY